MTSLTFVRKTDNPITLTFKSGGVALDITNYTVFFTVKKSSNSLDNDTGAVISKTITSHTDPTHGITVVNLTAADLTIQPGNYQYDVAFIDNAGKRHGINPDSFVVISNTTQRSA